MNKTHPVIIIKNVFSQSDSLFELPRHTMYILYNTVSL